MVEDKISTFVFSWGEEVFVLLTLKDHVLLTL